MQPRPNLPQYEAEAELKIREQERKRDFKTYPGDTSDASYDKRLSRRAFVFMQLTVMLLIIVSLVILYHLAH